MIVEVEKEKLQQLIDNFYHACSIYEKKDIYDADDLVESIQEMKMWVNQNFGRKLK